MLKRVTNWRGYLNRTWSLQAKNHASDGAQKTSERWLKQNYKRTCMGLSFLPLQNSSNS